MMDTLESAFEQNLSLGKNQEETKTENDVRAEQEEDEQNDQKKEVPDTTYRKLFVGGLKWDIDKESLQEYFSQFGNVEESVVIYDRNTGRSKGYGFVTFAQAEDAQKATEDPNPVIGGRKANCNLAYLGARKDHTKTYRRQARQLGGFGFPQQYPAGRMQPPPYYFPQMFPGFPTYSVGYQYPAQDYIPPNYRWNHPIPTGPGPNQIPPQSYPQGGPNHPQSPQRMEQFVAQQ